MSSPFASRLGTNYCPADEELAQIQGLLIEPCLRLKHLDDEIAVIRTALDKLNAERDTIAKYVATHKALLSPLRRLPRDIIEEIFLACLPTHRNCVMSATEAPVILGRICSSWRTISLSTPRLWSRLHIVQPQSLDFAPGLRKVGQRLEVGNAWLKRSGNCPLSISFQSVHSHYIPSQESHQFMKLLVLHASRWQNICLSIPTLVLNRLSHLTENDVPLLKDLQLSLHSLPFDHIPKWAPSSIFHAPKLSRFSIEGSSMKASDLPLRWNQLTDLEL
ncbi:hypothetical protein B0H12DRAFT_1051591, partial [Mycena haematopus]